MNLFLIFHELTRHPSKSTITKFFTLYFYNSSFFETNNTIPKQFQSSNYKYPINKSQIQPLLQIELFLTEQRQINFQPSLPHCGQPLTPKLTQWTSPSIGFRTRERREKKKNFTSSSSEGGLSDILSLPSPPFVPRSQVHRFRLG